MVTSHEVARLAGVSQPTVSRALRDSTKVSEQTKRRVREAAAALGYVPSATGRALSMGRSGRLGLLLTDLENQFYQHVMAPMHHALDEVGYQLVLMTESSEAGPIADRIVANGLDGVLLTTTTTDSILPIRLRDRSIPFVYFNRTSSAVDADSVTVDPLPGVEEMVKEITALGHREVAGIFGPRNTSTGVDRETCIRDQLGALGITIQPDRALHGPFDFETGYDSTKRLLSGHSQPTVIICGNDVVAIGALNAAAERGITVPGDVSIVGFDDLPTADWALVKLSTIAFDLDKMSRDAAQLLVERVEGRSDAAFRHIVYPTRFRPRSTLGPAPLGRRA